MQMTARLVPGVTTVTTNARYYALHAFVAETAARERLDWSSAVDFLRRCEVVIAAATISHPSDVSSFTAHGSDKIAPAWSSGSLSLDAMSQPGQYTKAKQGFLNVYLGSELEMGILGSSMLEPGERSNMLSLRSGFDGLTELARQPAITTADIEPVGHLSMHAARETPDGQWLARILCASNLDEMTDTDHARRGTIRLCHRSLQLAQYNSLESLLYETVAYGDAARTDPVLTAIAEHVPWRSTLLRRHSINAWRTLWAWLVDLIGEGEADIDGHTDPSTLVERAVEACSGTTGTVGDFVRELPAVVDVNGDPVDAEGSLRGEGRHEFEQAVATIALGGRRVDHFDGDAFAAFAGRRRTVLDPVWANEQFSQAGRPMADFLNGFVHDVLDRSSRIAMRRSRMQNGLYVVPGRVHEHAGRLWRTSREGRNPVGLRLNELERNLLAVGVLDRTDGALSFTAFGEELLDG